MIQRPLPKYLGQPWLTRVAEQYWHLRDHALGFDKNLRNEEISWLESHDFCGTLLTEYFINTQVRQLYPNIKFELDFPGKTDILNVLGKEHVEPNQKMQFFLCSFNGSEHQGRKLLLSRLHRLGWSQTVILKNFTYTASQVDGYLQEIRPDAPWFTHLFLNEESDWFGMQIKTIAYDQYNHKHNFIQLRPILDRCFVHLVSETLATSYHPFVTEKFIYSVASQQLFVAYAQPHWHRHISEILGFGLYNKIFDYSFDQILCPVDRVLALTSMLSQFANLSTLDWHDLWQIEKETIESNFDHYFSGRYLENMQTWAC